MADESEPIVLVVDERDVATSFEMSLVDDYDVRVAASGEHLKIVYAADVILLGWMMPGMSGDEISPRFATVIRSGRWRW